MVDDGIQRTVLVIGGAAKLYACRPFALTCSLNSCTKRDLPIPGSPLSSTTWPAPVFGLLPASLQQAQFFFAPDQRSQRTPREAGGLLGWAVSKTASCG